MAEFCIDCENRMSGPDYEPIEEWEVITDWDFCEGCGEWKQCIVAYRWWYHGPRRIVHHDKAAKPIGAGLKNSFRQITQIFKKRGE